MKWLIIVMVIVLACNPSSAEEDSHHFPMDLHDLGLTSQQHKAVEGAMREYQQAYRNYHAKSEKTRKELNVLFLKSTFDDESFRVKNLEMERASIEIRVRLFSHLHTILTPEQKRRFIRHMQEWDVE